MKIQTLHAEYLKIKGTPTLWFTILSSLFLPIIMFLIYFFKYKHFIPADGVNPWIEYFNKHFSLIASLFFPFYLILSSALNLSIEHKSHSWKKLLLLPINRTNLFLTKSLLLLLQTIFATLLFLASMLFFGYLVGTIHPELKLLKFAPELGTFLILLSRLLIASLGILSIHYVISLFLSNIILPITFGIAGTITALIVTSKWKYAIYFPYSYSSILYQKYAGRSSVQMWLGLTISEWLSLALTIIVMIIGVLLFRRKQLK